MNDNTFEPQLARQHNVYHVPLGNTASCETHST